MLSLSVKDLTGNKVITKIDRVAFTDLIAKLNLDSVVYPYVLTDEYILQYVRAKNNGKGSNVVKIYKFNLYNCYFFNYPSLILIIFYILAKIIFFSTPTAHLNSHNYKFYVSFLENITNKRVLE